MNSGKTILIVGGTGFIGRALVKYLLQKGFAVSVLTRNLARAKAIFPELVGVYSWPATNEMDTLKITNSFEVVINLAGENIGAKRWTATNKRKILQSRVESIKNLQQIIQQMPRPPKTWIQISATGFYGYNTISEMGETAPKGDGFLAEVVQKWETTFSELSLISTRKVILRLGVVISPKGGFLKKLQYSFNWGVAVCPGNGQQKLSWIHLDDLMEIINESIQNNDYTGIINAVSPNAAVMSQVTQVVKNYSQAWIKLNLPAFIFKFLLGGQKANELILSNQHIVPAFLLKKHFTFKHPNFESVFNEEAQY